jgi:hypothetical protein
MSTFFERLMQVAGYHGIKNVQKLSEHLGYSSPEKLYRLERDPNAKPSFKVILDITKKFDNFDLEWLITGERSEPSAVKEPAAQYQRITFEEIVAEKVAEKMEPMLNQIRKNIEYIQIEISNISEHL